MDANIVAAIIGGTVLVVVSGIGAFAKIHGDLAREHNVTRELLLRLEGRVNVGEAEQRALERAVADCERVHGEVRELSAYLGGWRQELTRVADRRDG